MMKNQEQNMQALLTRVIIKMLRLTEHFYLRATGDNFRTKLVVIWR
jgi:hypothetical protein